MKLYVIRHAIAADSARDGDDARPLTPKGRARFGATVAALARLDVELDLLLHSPLLRAVQTAELLVPRLRGESRVTQRLAEAPTTALLSELRGETVAVVGHEPWLSELVAWLVTGDRRLGPRFALDKGSLAALDGRPAPGEMTLEFLAPASLLAALGDS